MSGSGYGCRSAVVLPIAKRSHITAPSRRDSRSGRLADIWTSGDTGRLSLRAGRAGATVTLNDVTQTPTAPPNTGADEGAAALRPAPGNSRRQTDGSRGQRRIGRGRLAAYVALTKPRIIELLLVTTLPAMILAADGLPRWWVVVATMVAARWPQAAPTR